MIVRENVLKNVEDAVFKAITESCCMEENALGNVTYYLHGDEETGDLYECSGEHNPSNVLFTAEYKGEMEDDFGYESKDNTDFMDVVNDLSDQWLEKYGENDD